MKIGRDQELEEAGLGRREMKELVSQVNAQL